MYYPVTKHTKHRYMKLSSSATYPNRLQPPGSQWPGSDRSELPTVWLLEFLQCPINPLQLTVLTCSTAHQLCVCVYVCVREKENLEGAAAFSVLYHPPACRDHTTVWQEDGDGACLFVLIDTNEQGLAEVILAVFRLGAGYLLSW